MTMILFWLTIAGGSFLIIWAALGNGSMSVWERTPTQIICLLLGLNLVVMKSLQLYAKFFGKS